MQHPDNTMDKAVPRKALLELQRLVEEADQRFKEDSPIEACSSLVAIPAVLDPLVQHLQSVWVTLANGMSPTDAASDEFPPGQYL